MNKSFFIIFTGLLSCPLYGAQVNSKNSEIAELDLSRVITRSNYSADTAPIDEHPDLHNDSSTTQKKNRRFPCNSCNKVCGNRGALTVHLRTHEKEKAVHCEYCPKFFFENSKLKTHIEKVHSKAACTMSTQRKRRQSSNKGVAKPFKCPICDRNFIRKGNLTLHRRTHGETERLYCAHCHKAFVRKQTLQTQQKRSSRLQRSLHNRFLCSVCKAIAIRK